MRNIFIGILLMLAGAAYAEPNDWVHQIERSNDRFDNSMMINTQASQVNAMYSTAQQVYKPQTNTEQSNNERSIYVQEKPLYKLGE